jgi:hypothetical protein
MLSKDGVCTLVHVVVADPIQTNLVLKVLIFKRAIAMIAT